MSGRRQGSGGSARRPWLTRAAALSVPVLVATLAVIHPGAAVSQVDLNDGAVWLTNTSVHRVGRYNPVVDELNAGVVSDENTFDVLQDRGDVLLVESGRLALIDPASVALGGQTSVPWGAEVSMAAGTTAVGLPGSGDVWARPTQMIGSLRMDQDDPDLELGDGGLAVTARFGAVLGVEPDGAIHRLRVAADGAVTVSSHGRLAGTPTAALEQITAVGDQAVVLAGTTVYTPSGTVDLSGHGTELVLQQPGPRAGSVAVATPSSLLLVPLGGGAPRVHTGGGTGTPAAPVVVAGCTHGAWASATGNYVQVCAGQEPVVEDLTEMTASSRLVFRVNRDVVVLNDTQGGRVWLPMEDPEVRDLNWEDIATDEEVDESTSDEQSPVVTQALQVECTPQSAPPTAADDEFGVRPGRSMILPVIDNDASSSCGILAISEYDPVPASFGTLAPVYGGRALQLTTHPDATGTVEFTYTVNDGRGHAAPSTATVELTARPFGTNAAPEQTSEGVMVVELGGAGTYNVLADFVDPDGDQLMLVGATATGGTARTRGDGELRFTSDGGALGRQTVRVRVSDGESTTEGVVVVDVRPAGSLAPVIDPVHALTYVDQPVVLHPLDHVRTESREPVRLAGADEVQGLTVESDLDAATVTVTARTAGTYYVPFLVTASPQQATGLARIDVRELPEQSPPPVATLDLALLPPGGEVTIDPLANDVDPAGGVLVLQHVEAPTDSGLRVARIGHRLLRITATRTLEEPVVLDYTISNGTTSADGEVIVQPVPAAALQQAPIVPDLRATVRTGGVVTIPALEDAFDPDGDVLTVVRDLVEPPGQGEGLMFVSGDLLRYQAPSTPGDVRATFAVTDPFGNETAATVHVTVHPSDAETKPPPRPESLTARVYEGETVRIDVPLTGIDVDGDGVLLLGVDRAPAMGRVVEIGPDWMEYQALPGEFGTDVFSYAVEDWTGQRSVGSVRVGIAPRPLAAAEVISRDDAVAVRPGQSVEVRVLANDVDTGDGELTLDETLEVPEGVEAEVQGRRILVSTDRAGQYPIVYTARNERGGQDTGVLTVTVSDDAPILPPVAKDVVVPAVETIGRSSIEVSVLEVAQNPSGPLSDLDVTVDPAAEEVTTVTDDGTVVVTLIDAPQTLPYRLTNTDPDANGLSSYAFITVPALGDFPPVLRQRVEELRVIAGETLEIGLAAQVQVAPGKTAQIGDYDTLSATKSDGSDLFVDDHTLRYVAERDYAGPASISVLVSDGPSSAPTTRSSMITLPITVLAAEEHPPTFAPSVLDVPQGETSRVDLAVFTSAPVSSQETANRYTYTITGTPPGFDVSLAGSVLSVTARPNVARGTVAGISLDIGYGTSGVVPAQVDLRVTASSRPLARVGNHEVPDGVEGGLSTVSVLQGSFNPYPEYPLTVLGAVVETPGAGSATVSGSQVQVRPAAGFIGTMVTRYTVRDVIDDPARVVEGRITVIVRGRPATPTAPRIEDVRDRTVVLSWDAPANNGAPITGYRVTAQGGSIVRECSSTTCTIDGLTNNVEYSFTVAARNAVDWSDSSPPSAAARPDARPFAPAAPVATRGDQSASVTWSTPENPGSPITGYELEISPAAPGGSTFTTSATRFTATNLVNGQEYRFRVRARNLAPDAGEWSPWSSAVTPAGRPEPPEEVSATNQRTGWTTNEITVSWRGAFANGSPITGYEVRVEGRPTVRLGADVRSYTFSAVRGTRYPVTVRAVNAVGEGPWANTTGRIWSAPGAPTGLTASDAGPGTRDWGDGSVVLSWQPPDETGGSGVTITGYEIEGYNTINATSRTFNGLVGGEPRTYRIRAINSEGVPSEWATFPTVTPTTAPESPEVRFDTSEPGQVTVTWSTRRTGGTTEGLAFQYRLRRGGNWQGPFTETSHALPAGPGSGFDIEVQVRNIRGWSPTTSAHVDIPLVETPPVDDP